MSLGLTCFWISNQLLKIWAHRLVLRIRFYRDFNEAMLVTAKAKETFQTNKDDLRRRGVRLIEESLENGVTSMRAHVEVDTIVGFSCLEVALELKARYKDICDVQIAGPAYCFIIMTRSLTSP